MVSKQIFVRDRNSYNLIEHFPGICVFIHNALDGGAICDNKKRNVVLVHCYAGVSRSASAIIAYLIWARRLRCVQALWMLRTARSIVNPSFEKQLLAWQMWLDEEKEKRVSLVTHTVSLGLLKKLDKAGPSNMEALDDVQRPFQNELCVRSTPTYSKEREL